MFWSWLRPRALEAFLSEPVDAALALGDGLEAQDEGDDLPPDGREQWRCLVLNAKAFAQRDAVPPQLQVRFRLRERRAWSARVSNLGLARGLRVAGARTPCDFTELSRRLGEPDRSVQVSLAARGHWFDRAPLLYVIEARSRPEEPVLSPSRAVGACLWVTVVDLTLAPPGFDGGWRAAGRRIFVRFPGSQVRARQGPQVPQPSR